MSGIILNIIGLCIFGLSYIIIHLLKKELDHEIKYNNIERTKERLRWIKSMCSNREEQEYRDIEEKASKLMEKIYEKYNGKYNNYTVSESFSVVLESLNIVTDLNYLLKDPIIIG